VSHCANCGHEERFHRDLFGLPLGCDVELAPRDDGGDILRDDGDVWVHLCGCANFVPMAEKVEVN
jgi:hypothetical protein